MKGDVILENSKNTLSKKVFIAVFLLPTFILYCTFSVYPIIKGLTMSFYKWSGYTNVMQFIGFDNYINLLKDENIARAILNDFIILFWKEIIILVLAIFFAVALTRLKFGKNEKEFYRVVFFFPNVMSVVVIGLLWSFVYHPSIGILNSGLKAIGLEKLTHAWFGEVETAVPAIIPVASWAAIGFFMIVFIAAIKNIPDMLYEAGIIDGAGEWKQLVCITIPLIWEQIKFSVIFILLTTLTSNYILVLVTTNGGPDSASQVMGLYVYELAFRQSRVGYATAVTVVLFLITFISTAIMNRVLKKEVIQI